MNSFKKVQEMVQRNAKEESMEALQDKITENSKDNTNRKEKLSFVDDGRSLTDMNVEGFSWYTPKKISGEKKALLELKITPKERLAMIFGALSVILPIALFILVMYTGAFFLISLWLK